MIKSIAELKLNSNTDNKQLYKCQITRVDLHRPKTLIIQFHTLSLWKNASHTNFIHFCKMSLIEFQRYFIVVLVSKLVSLLEKKGKKMV